MRVIPDFHMSFANIGSRVAHTGGSIASGVLPSVCLDVAHHDRRVIPADCGRVFLSLGYPEQ